MAVGTTALMAFSFPMPNYKWTRLFSTAILKKKVKQSGRKVSWTLRGNTRTSSEGSRLTTLWVDNAEIECSLSDKQGTDFSDVSSFRGKINSKGKIAAFYEKFEREGIAQVNVRTTYHIRFSNKSVPFDTFLDLSHRYQKKKNVWKINSYDLMNQPPQICNCIKLEVISLKRGKLKLPSVSLP